MYSPPFSFVSFNGDTGYSLPVREWGDVSFQVHGVDGSIVQVDLLSGEGNVLETSTNGIVSIADGVYLIVPMFQAVPDCFRLKLTSNDDEVAVSNLFHRDTSEHTLRVTYMCEGGEFGFAYTSTKVLNRVRLPILLKNPQYPQEDSIYKKFSGRRVVLGATIDKEWQLETDYLSDELHSKLLVALSHDGLWIDGKVYTKAGDYSIDWGSTLMSALIFTSEKTRWGLWKYIT